jgi:hypothetical protein
LPNGALIFNGHVIPPCDATHPCHVDFQVVPAKEVR